MAPPVVPIKKRFDAKYRIDQKTGCWVWTAALRPNGYPQFRYSKQKNGYGHRFSYEHHVGAIPNGMHLHHICENKSCVNPEHLELLTPRVHVLERTEGVAATNARKKHCRRGHPLRGDNVSVYRGRRRCLTCYEQWRQEQSEYLRAYNRQYYLDHR